MIFKLEELLDKGPEHGQGTRIPTCRMTTGTRIPILFVRRIVEWQNDFIPALNRARAETLDWSIELPPL